MPRNAGLSRLSPRGAFARHADWDTRVQFMVRITYFNAMKSSGCLDEIIERAIADSTLEPLFLRTLLKAELYVHLPLSDDSGRARLLQFTRPDGLTVIPIFSSLDKAERAASGAVRVGRLTGRNLLEATRGATLMLNPNDTNTTLYPEEIQALLDEGLASVSPRFDEEQQPLEVAPCAAEDDWLGNLIIEAIDPIQSALTLYLFSARLPDLTDRHRRLLAVLVVPANQSERAARAIGVAIEAGRRPPGCTVDLITLTPTEPLPEWLIAAGVAPKWKRGPNPTTQLN